jgi:hypothetical protein
MTYSSWVEPVEILRSQCGPATLAQIALAHQIGLPLDPELPLTVAASLLDEHLHPTIWASNRHVRRPASSKQLEFLSSLAPELDAAAMTVSEASAWIDHFLSLRTIAALETLQLRAGDEVNQTVVFADPATGEVQDAEWPATVSSIGANGLVYFKGGNGKCAWPIALSRVDS